MKKLFCLLILVIILVSLHWFKQGFAQDLSSLSAEQRAALMRQYQQYQKSKVATRAGSDNPEAYTSPPIYDSTSAVGVPDSMDYDYEFPPDSLDEKNHGSRLQSFDDLQPFGQDLFRGPRETTPPDDIASADDYILGPGDNVIIYLWGRVEQEYNLTVDREGTLFIPKVGTVSAWGKSVEEFKRAAQKKFASVYSDFDLTVSLGRIRSIRIYLTGEVARPGAYTVSSLTSLFNALYLAGGPTAEGSMRSIRLMRSGKQVGSVDLYRFLLEGDNSTDVRLQSGDAIFVPVAGDRVAVRGEVRRPGIYELKGEETSRDALRLAGGATPQAHLDRVMLERINASGEWQVLDLALNPIHPDLMNDIALDDGDRMSVYSIFDSKRNMVAINGRVRHPGYYERTDSTRVSDLIERGQLHPYDVYYERANLFRRYSDWRTEVIPIDLRAAMNGDSTQDIVLHDKDSLHVYAIDEVTWEKQVYIEGEVVQPGSYPLYNNMTVQDLVFLAGSYTRSASLLRGEIARIDSLGQVSLHYVGLNAARADATFLQENDHVYVRKIPQWQLHRTVYLDGEALYPGEYVLASRDETLYQLLSRAGGFTESAFPLGTILERKAIGKSMERLRIPRLLAKSNPLVQDSLGNTSREMIFEYEPESINRIILDMETLIASDGQIGDIVLQPGDRIFVPSIPSGISVIGAVGSNGTIKYSENRKVKYYVERAGNFTPQSDKNNTRLIRANGEVFAGGGTLGKKVQMGDIIVVPTKIEKEHDWFRTFSTALTATTGLITSVLLINKL